MLMNALNQQVFLCLLLCIAGITAAAHAAGVWPAFVHNQAYNSNNRTQFNQPGFRGGVSNPQAAKYGQVHLNQSRPSWQQQQASNNAMYPSYGQQGNFNRTASNYGPYPGYGQHANLNQARPPISNYPYSSMSTLNQTRPSGPQQIASNYPQYPVQGQYGSLNQNRPN